MARELRTRAGRRVEATLARRRKPIYQENEHRLTDGALVNIPSPP